MVAKISIGSSLYGALAYNSEKINKEEGRLLGANKIILPADGQIDIGRIAENFREFMPMMGRTKKPVLHISLNPHPDDKLTDQDFEILAREYLEKLGFGEQPFIIYKHEDIDRHHIHIVTVNVNEQGKRLNQDFLFRRSKKITTELEEKYNLHKAQREKITPDMPIKKVDPSGDIKRQVANTVKMVGMRYKFQTMGEYNAVINSFIKQMIEKGYSGYIYDFKSPDLSEIAYNHLLTHKNRYGKVKPKFYMINFDDPERSHRCNPIHPDFMTDIADAYESAYTIMLNLNKSWVSKQGDFFVESPIVLFAAIIWYLRIYKNGIYCTFPHAIELLNRRYEDLFPILTSYQELENYLSPFMDAWQGGAAEQLMGQIASAKIPLSRMISPQLYWVMTGDDFTLDINNPKEPKILCVGNNPDRQNIYGAALGLYNSRIVKIINKKGKLKSGVLIDELPTIYFKGLDNLIATARSNKVAVCLGFQDFSQLKRDYGDKEAAVVMNTVGNIFSGQVVGETAKTLSERFGKVLQKRQSISINRQDVSHSINTQMDSLIPPSKISTLTQGMFVGAVCDNINERIDQKIFHAEIVIDSAKVKAETSKYKPIPILTDFKDDTPDKSRMKAVIQRNYEQVKADVIQIIADEKERIMSDPILCHLFDPK